MTRLSPIASLQADIARIFGVPKRVLTNRELPASALQARWAGMFIARNALGKSHSEIARRFGRHPATIRHGIAQARRLIDEDVVFAGQVRELEARL